MRPGRGSLRSLHWLGMYRGALPEFPHANGRTEVGLRSSGPTLGQPCTSCSGGVPIAVAYCLSPAQRSASNYATTRPEGDS
jgi:hypothetical protein